MSVTNNHKKYSDFFPHIANIAELASDDVSNLESKFELQDKIYSLGKEVRYRSLHCHYQSRFSVGKYLSSLVGMTIIQLIILEDKLTKTMDLDCKAAQKCHDLYKKLIQNPNVT